MLTWPLQWNALYVVFLFRLRSSPFQKTEKLDTVCNRDSTVGQVAQATDAYREMLAFRSSSGVDQIRAELLASPASGSTDDTPLEDRLPWPYLLPQFRPLLSGPWKGVPPCIPIGTDAIGNYVTMTVFPGYRLPEIVTADLGELWLRLVMYCDVYFDLLLHTKSELTGLVLARRDVVDFEGIGLTDMTPGSLALLKRLGELSRHYPEAIARTDAVNFSIVATTLFKMVWAITELVTARIVWCSLSSAYAVL